MCWSFFFFQICSTGFFFFFFSTDLFRSRFGGLICWSSRSWRWPAFWRNHFSSHLRNALFFFSLFIQTHVLWFFSFIIVLLIVLSAIFYQVVSLVFKDLLCFLVSRTTGKIKKDVLVLEVGVEVALLLSLSFLFSKSFWCAGLEYK